MGTLNRLLHKRKNQPPDYGTTGNRGAEATRQRGYGVYGPGGMNGEPNAQGLRPGDPGYYAGGKNTYLWRDQEGGYDALLSSMEGNESASDAIQRLITQFQGSPDQLADFMERAGPLFGSLEAQRSEKSDAYKYMADQRNWDLGATGAYGSAAGQIAQSTGRAQRQAQQGLAAQGLGLGTGSAAIGAMLKQQGGAQQADLQSKLIQQAAQNRMQSANNLFDAHRSIAQMALGQGITPRITSPQGSEGVGLAQGAAQGAMAGSAFGPWGAVIGGVAGAGLSAAQRR